MLPLDGGVRSPSGMTVPASILICVRSCGMWKLGPPSPSREGSPGDDAVGLDVVEREPVVEAVLGEIDERLT
jgi:hypothetical protein